VVMLHPAAAAMKLGFLPLRGSPAHAEHRQECSAGPKRETGCTQRHSEPAPVKWKLDAAGAARNEHMETTALASRQRDMACFAPATAASKGIVIRSAMYRSSMRVRMGLSTASPRRVLENPRPAELR
jgi:hypothetical protein